MDDEDSKEENNNNFAPQNNNNRHWPQRVQFDPNNNLPYFQGRQQQQRPNQMNYGGYGHLNGQNRWKKILTFK